jgi:hypothetical protein
MDVKTLITLDLGQDPKYSKLKAANTITVQKVRN